MRPPTGATSSPTVPRPRGEGWAQTHPPQLLPPPARSLLPLRQRQHWKTAPAAPGTPTPAPPLPGFWGSPTGKGGSWQGAGAGTPPFLLPPQCSALTHPKQELLPPPAPGFAPGPLQRGQQRRDPQTH